MRKTRSGKSHDYHNGYRYPKASFSDCFSSTVKCKAGVFQFLQFEERFQEAKTDYCAKKTYQMKKRSVYTLPKTELAKFLQTAPSY